MTTKTLKKQIHEAIEIVESPELLQAVYLILSNDRRRKEELLKPFTLEEFYDRQNRSQKDIKSGKLIEHKSIKKKYNSK
ncbi:MAG TPA: hypothetical protein VNB90_07780 [Cytophagaceae bacterium]|jgi:hypothetical protein|nr:hypothetical protein [Cytophagaceae bacterium]